MLLITLLHKLCFALLSFHLIFGLETQSFRFGRKARSFGLIANLNLTFDTKCDIIILALRLGVLPLSLERVLTYLVEQVLECAVLIPLKKYRAACNAQWR